jgi:hypothetical protein
MCNEALEGLLREFSLDLDGLVESLDADELLERRGVRLELLLGEIGNLDANRLEALRQRAEILEGGVKALLPEFLEVFILRKHHSILSVPTLVGLIEIVRRHPTRAANLT